MKHYWRCHRTLHYITGLLAVLIIIASALFALSKNDWKILKTPHTIAGVVTFILAVLLGLGGIFSAVTLRYKTHDWDSQKFVKGKVVHKIFGLGLTIGSQFTQGAGILAFFNIDQDKERGKLLLWLNVVFFFTMLIIGEVIYQLNLRKQTPFNINEVSITKAEFDERIHEGE